MKDMRNKLSNFLFPIVTENEKNGLAKLSVKFRFGIFSVIIWKIFCLITGEK